MGATPPGTTIGGGIGGGIGVTPPGTNVSGPLIPLGTTPPGTTGAVGTNPWSRFVANLVVNGAFNAAGRIFADGAGNLYASAEGAALLTNTLVGTYTVNTDCSLTMSLRDPFPATAGGVVTTTGGPTVTLEGLIIDGRIEAVMTNPNAAGATITFVKTSQFNACSNTNLTGTYGLVGSGAIVPGAVTPAATTGVGIGTATTGGSIATGTLTTLGTAFNILGRFNADGNGVFLPDLTTVTTTSTVRRTIVGTYTVNIDCTGTARLVDSTTGATRNISFVLVNETAPVGTVATASQQSLRFVFTDPGVIGGGTAALQ
jgi:hypothetical protein